MTDLETFGGFHLRAVGGGPLVGARVFRSRELSDITPDEVYTLVYELGIRSIYDIRNQWEVAAHPQPYPIGTKTVALEPSSEARRKDAHRRLVAGVIGGYGKPEERMRRNYRRYVSEYPLIGAALRGIASEGVPALLHCVNGKDRSGVMCAMLLAAAGVDRATILADYLATNDIDADDIAAEAAELGRGMTPDEHAILMSFLEARESYLDAFFDEVEVRYGSLETYLTRGLHLTVANRLSLEGLLA